MVSFLRGHGRKSSESGSASGPSSGSSAPALVAQVTFGAVILLMICMMLYGYRLLRGYNRELLQMAYHDPLTGAENLLRFRQRLTDALHHTGGSVAALSIRQFPFLAELFGTEKTEQLLCRIRETMELHIRKDEFFCRDTEDRFYLFLQETDRSAVRGRLEALLGEMERNAKIGGTDLSAGLLLRRGHVRRLR